MGSITSHCFFFVCVCVCVCVNSEGLLDRPMAYSAYPSGCGSKYEDSTFSSVILRLCVVQLESDSRPPEWWPDAQLTEPIDSQYCVSLNYCNAAHASSYARFFGDPYLGIKLVS